MNVFWDYSQKLTSGFRVHKVQCLNVGYDYQIYIYDDDFGY